MDAYLSHCSKEVAHKKHDAHDSTDGQICLPCAGRSVGLPGSIGLLGSNPETGDSRAGTDQAKKTHPHLMPAICRVIIRNIR